MNKLRIALAALLGAVSGAGCVSPHAARTPAVGDFELSRYAGTWYEIARLPQWFERGMDEVSATYTPSGDGFDVVNRGVRDGEPRSVRARGRLCGPPGTAEMEVSFFRPFYSRYAVIKLEPDYSIAAVTGSDTDSFWILARTPEIPPEKLSEYVEFARGHGFNVDKLIYPAHSR